MSKTRIDEAREEFSAKKDVALASFAKVQMAILNANNHEWNSATTEALEKAASDLSVAVRQAQAAEWAITVAFTNNFARPAPTGPAPADLTGEPLPEVSPELQAKSIAAEIQAAAAQK